MTVRVEPDGVDPLPLAQLRQPALRVVGLAAGEFVDGLDVGLEEAGEGDGAAAGAERDIPAVGLGAVDAQAQRGAAGVGHLRGHRALPDQLVEAVAVGVEFGAQRPRSGKGVTGRADGLVRLLGVLDLAGVLPRRRVDVLLAVELTGLVARGVDRRLRQRRGVGSHIGDEAVLVQPLSHAHRAVGGEPQLAAGLLLQSRGHEGRIGPTGVRLLLHRGHGQCSTAQPGRQRGGGGLVEHQHLVGLLDRADGIEIASGGDPLAVHRDQPGGEPGRGGARIGDAGVEFGEHVPVGGAAEGHPLPLALHDDPGGHRLHPAGRELGADLLPQHRADLVAVEPVEDAAGLLGVNQVGVQVTRVLCGLPDGRFGDLVEHHPADRDARLQRLQQVPGDGLALAVTVGGEIELVDVLEQALEFGDDGLLVGADHIERFEVVVDVDTGAGPLLRLVLGRDVGSALGQVADVPPGGLDNVVRAQITGNFARFSGRLDDDEPPDAAGITGTVVASQLRLRSTSLISRQAPPAMRVGDPSLRGLLTQWHHRTGGCNPTPRRTPLRPVARQPTPRLRPEVPQRSPPGATAACGR